jgi:tetratricopeptide (TPR) repeat protein
MLAIGGALCLAAAAWTWADQVSSTRAKSAGGAEPPGEKREVPAAERHNHPAGPPIVVIRRRAHRALLPELTAALRLLADGSAQDAREALEQTELAARGEGSFSDGERLLRANRRVVEILARADVESLVPLMLLRYQTYLDYHRRGDAFLMDHAVNATRKTVKEYLAGSRASDARHLAAGVLAAFGGEYQRDAVFNDSRALFDESLGVDEHCTAALMGLGATFEVLGRYDLAVIDFSRAHGLEPDDPETQLRLGVNLVRLGRHKQGEALLRGCLPPETPHWIAVVAFEELGRLLLADGRPGEADTLLQQASQRFPDERALLIERVTVLDRLNRPFEARELLQSTWTVHEPAGESPRYRYTQWPQRALDVLEEDVKNGAAQRMTALATGLRLLEATGG